MKALSIRQPFATLIHYNKKTIEVRSRQIHYRGDILICSAKQIHQGKVFFIDESGNFITEPARKYQKTWGKDLRGHALCIAELYDCTPFEPEHQIAAMIPHLENQYAWHLRNIREVDSFPVHGKLGLFNVELKNLMSC